MKASLKFLALLFLVSLPVHAQVPTTVSLIQLVSDPEKYHGKEIQVIAFLRVEFEGNALYMHKEDYEFSITKNGIWIELPSQPIEVTNKLNNSYVIAMGTFNSKNRGHLDLWSGSLANVTRLEKWPHNSELK